MAETKDTDATHILSADHRTVEKLFEDYEKASGTERKRAIANDICNELKIHAQIEEEIFYPALKGKIDDDLLKEAYVEHDGAKLLINQIAEGGPDEDYYDAKDTDATHILAADHRTVEKLFEDYEKASGTERKRAIANDICNELKIHAQIEEEIFYPALKGKIDDDLLKEAYVEHDGAKLLINQIAEGGPDEDYYDAKVTVLKEEIEHHVKEEEKERDNMFQQARAADVDLNALGEQMLSRKNELQELAKTGSLPPAKMTTMS